MRPTTHRPAGLGSCSAGIKTTASRISGLPTIALTREVTTVRHLAVLAAFATVGLLLPSAISAENIKGGREYVRQQREIQQLKKQLAADEKEIHEFEQLLEEIDSLSLPRRIDDFWAINEDARKAMIRERDEFDDEDAADSDCFGRMNLIIKESHGLQRVMAAGDMDVFPRYRHLLEEFLGLMQENLESSRGEIDRRVALLNG